MPDRTYSYTVEGEAADGQTWKVTGIARAAQGDFLSLPDKAAKETFERLTKGRAEYGKPGVGCKGPYRFTMLLIKDMTLNVIEGGGGGE